MQRIRYALIAGIGVGALGILAGACSGGSEEVRIPSYNKIEDVTTGIKYGLRNGEFFTDEFVIAFYDRDHDGNDDVREYRHVLVNDGRTYRGQPGIGVGPAYQICFDNGHEWECYVDSNLDGAADERVDPDTVWAVDKSGNRLVKLNDANIIGK